MLEKILSNAGVTLNGNNPYDLQVHDERFFKKLFHNPSLVAGESYMDGWWDCPQLDELYARVLRHNDMSAFDNPSIKFLTIVLNKLFNHQSKSKSQQVAKQHYNIGNDLYQYMLGTSMAYTCAYWKHANTLDLAQAHKYELICKKIKLQAHDRVLDLGCGWGGFAKYAAEHYGCAVVAVNIASAQIDYAQQWCQHLPITFCLSDYRDHQVYNPKALKFDKIVSIGLCEHVGIKNYRPFIQLARQQLNDDGLFLLHTIGKNITEDYMDSWANKYIFPNGVLPSIQTLSAAFENQFVVEDLHNFGADYDKTLMAWHHNFNQHWDKIADKYDQRFFRMWNYYLLSCAGGFRARDMQLWQFVLSPRGVVNGYQRID